MEVIAQGNLITVKVKGLVTADYVDNASTYVSGRIVLQKMDKTTDIRFRNIEIKELPSPRWIASEFDKDQAEKAGWVQLFNRKNTDGWKPHPEQPGDWSVKEGILVGQGKENYLYSERADYENFHLRAEVRINQTGNGGVLFRTAFSPKLPDGYEVQIDPASDQHRTGSLMAFPWKADTSVLAHIKKSPVPADTWCLLEVIAARPTIVVKVNGQTVANVLHEQYTRGHIALQTGWGGNTVVQFRRIEIKELAPTVTLQPKAAYNVAGGRLRQAVFLPGGKEVATASGGKVIAIDIQTGATRVLCSAPGSFWSVSLSPDGNTLAVGHDKLVLLYDLKEGKELPPLAPEGKSPVHVAFCARGKLLAVGHRDGSIDLWDWAAHKPKGELKGHTKGIGFLRLSPDGRHLASGSEDMTARIWDIDGKEEPRILRHQKSIWGGAYSLDGSYLAVGESNDGVLRIWDTAKGTEVRQFHGNKGWHEGVAFSPTLPLIASSGAGGRILLWHRETGEVVADLPAEGDEYTYFLMFTEDGKTLITASTRNQGALLKVYDVSAFR